MENNFTSFFPLSSSAAATTTSLNMGSYHGFTDYFQAKEENGFSGLIQETEDHHHHAVVGGLNGNNTNNNNSNLSSSQNKSFTNGSENEEKLLLGTKKKGSEKKIRKPRYAFQTRSQVDILDDGYRWRKYGQKAVKNNKFPRSYYRCTHQGCNVKKQVQRLTRDEGIVVTTYEGMHSHPIEKSTDNFEHILSQMQIYTTSF
uniref:WRKY super family protein n=1 Tax=Hevea brasiliensis TaxID=3981 RepID=A0A0U1WT51_HEVBR|nr:WRKY super family protein [Hevea brasiliensis]AMP82323.1 WRKY75 [Hevea brasiliensis]